MFVRSLRNLASTTHRIQNDFLSTLIVFSTLVWASITGAYMALTCSDSVRHGAAGSQTVVPLDDCCA